MLGVPNTPSIGSKHCFAGNSWWHVKQVERGGMDMTQKKASNGRTNNASKGVDESVWAVQLVEHAGTKVTNQAKRARATPSQSAQAGRPTL
jgi:hypothetical protein